MTAFGRGANEQAAVGSSINVLVTVLLPNVATAGCHNNIG